MKNGLIEYANGTKVWYMNGSLHRVDGPAAEYADGSREWYIDGKRNRVDGPAVEYADGTKSWYKFGKCHRVDGPAIEWADGKKEWYIDDEEYTFSEWIKLSKLTKDEITELVLYYG